jgi:lysyl-tRNA synthetase class 2
MLEARAGLLRRIREFFAAREVLEVETPLLGSAGTTDPHLQSFRVPVGADEWYLQTSPEFAMKRLLAAGSGPIFQIGKAFRQGENGRHHNLEFTILEWYRPGYDMDQLMEEVTELIACCLGSLPFVRASYRAIFVAATGLDPHEATLKELRALARLQPALARVEPARGSDRLARGEMLDLLFAHLVEPSFPDALLVHDFPQCQAALARIAKDEAGINVARRFEVYVGGLELANGYLELLDAAELRTRFEEDNRERLMLGREQMPIDEMLLAAMEAGLPDCSGVALGVDRLLMLATGAQSIRDVISFPMAP